MPSRSYEVSRTSNILKYLFHTVETSYAVTTTLHFLTSRLLPISFVHAVYPMASSRDFSPFISIKRHLCSSPTRLHFYHPSCSTKLQRSSSLQITDWFFRYASHCLWNHLPNSFRQPHPGLSTSDAPHLVLVRFSVDSMTFIIHHSATLSLLA